MVYINGLSLDIFDGEHLYFSQYLGKGIHIIIQSYLNYFQFQALRAPIVI